MEKDGKNEMDRQNTKCSCARKKNNAGTYKEEEKKLTGPLAAEGCSRRATISSAELPKYLVYSLVSRSSAGRTVSSRPLRGGYSPFGE